MSHTGWNIVVSSLGALLEGPEFRSPDVGHLLGAVAAAPFPALFLTPLPKLAPKPDPDAMLVEVCGQVPIESDSYQSQASHIRYQLLNNVFILMGLRYC